jgi:hypothetical protein
VANKKFEEKVCRYTKEYEEFKSQLKDIGFILQGNLSKRYMKCGKASCECHNDPEQRHGPYYQWSGKYDNKTVSIYLDDKKATLCKEWNSNNRKLEAMIKMMRKKSRQLGELYGIVPKKRRSKK